MRRVENGAVWPKDGQRRPQGSKSIEGCVGEGAPLTVLFRIKVQVSSFSNASCLEIGPCSAGLAV